MTPRLRAATLALAILASGLALTPTAPASPFEDGCVGYPNVVAVDTFTVPAGTVQAFTEATAIQARNVNVAGILTTRNTDGGAAPSLCIETERLTVAAFGVICTAAGEDGLPSWGANHAQGEDGGDGGDLTLILRDLPATLTAPSLNVLGLVCSGDGGDGGPGILDPCLPAALGTTDSAIPTCPEDPGGDPEPCDALPAPCESSPCLPASLGFEDSAIPTCPEEPGCEAGEEGCLPDPCASGDCLDPCGGEDCAPDPCAGCVPDPCALASPCPVDVCSVPYVRRAFGGAAGDAGLLAIYATPTALSLAPLSLKAGTGGSGGDALTLGGLTGSNEAYAGTAGASRILINGAVPTGALLAAVGASRGGNGGNAFAGVAPECGGNDPCQDSIWQNRAYCIIRDVLDEVCMDDPHKGTVCDPLNDILKDSGLPLYGDRGREDADAPPGRDPAWDGENGDDATAGMDWQISCGFEVTTAPPYGAAGCSASAACDGSGHGAVRGFHGEPGYSGAAAIAIGKNGTYGVLLGGDGGSATASGAKGGDGGKGGNGGNGDAETPCGHHNGAPGGRGGSGGVGGMATAEGGNGGPSEVQGGKGGDVQANPGAGGAGGLGGNGGDPAWGCDPYTGSCTGHPTGPGTIHTSYGGYWGCGGAPGGRGGMTRDPGEGGKIESTGGYGPKGAKLPGTIPPPYGPHGKAGAQYLANPSCPV